MQLSIIIPVHNNVNFTKAALLDLIQLQGEYEIIIVDNGSTDNTAEVIKEISEYDYIGPMIKYIRNETNHGFALACNRGYHESIGENVMFLNNDIKVKNNHDNWAEALLPYCSEYLVGPTVGLIDKNCNFIKETDKLEPGIQYMSGWCLASSREIFDKLIINDYLGPFSQEFGLAFFEDTDLGIRANLSNVPFMIQPIPVHHFGHMTAKKLGMSNLYPGAQELFKKKWLGKL